MKPQIENFGKEIQGGKRQIKAPLWLVLMLVGLVIGGVASYAIWKYPSWQKARITARNQEIANICSSVMSQTLLKDGKPIWQIGDEFLYAEIQKLTATST